MANTLKINVDSALLEPIKFLASPHHDERPADVQTDMIVVHGISLPPGNFGNHAIADFFCGKLNFEAHPYFAQIANLRVSSHLLIKRDGEILQFVPFTKRAWHAGQSIFKNKNQCNDFSIGIELEGTDDIPYERVQYERLVEVSRLLMRTYPHITQDRIVGHSDIAPGRKTDPGPHFDWDFLRTSLKEC